MRLTDDLIQITARLLHNDGNLSPTLRHRLEPSGLWFGGGFQGMSDAQTFPLNQARIDKTGFLTNGATQGTSIWYTTKRVALWIRTPFDFRYTINRRLSGEDDGMLSVEITQLLIYFIHRCDRTQCSRCRTAQHQGDGLSPHSSPF